MSTNLLRFEVDGPFLWSSQIVSAELQPSYGLTKHRVYLDFTFTILDTFSISIPGIDILSIDLFTYEATYTSSRLYLVDRGL